jgi:4-hydroxythreonine-4-phosphate dehydrogenase
MKRPLVGITMGDPAGVGPELCLRILKNRRVLRQCVPIVFGDASVLKRAAKACRISLDADVAPLELWRRHPRARRALVADGCILRGSDIRSGRVQKSCGQAAYAYIEAAIEAAVKGWTAAVVTAPIHKESLRLAGIPYPGHTEILAELTGTDRVCMMLASDEITVSLVTTHIAYRDVPAQLSKSRILETIRMTSVAMKRMGKTRPRITVCALNPHAGEHGLFGDQERKQIEPAIRAARKSGICVTGPLPPDTAFLPDKRRSTDAYVVMYHDQGLIPFKMLAFDKGVNITLGLPIVRTSVDHGTAFDIAWKGKASPNSLVQAVLWAVRLAGKR